MPAPLRSSESSHGGLSERSFTEFRDIRVVVWTDGVRRMYGVVKKRATPNLADLKRSSRSRRTKGSSWENSV